MVKITNEIDGKKYELVPEICICKGCDLEYKCNENHPDMVNNIFNRCSVCGKLHGIWKEVHNGG